MPDKLLRTWRKIRPLLPLLTAIIMLLIASFNDFLSRGFYQILRILVCGLSGYFSFKSWKEKHYNWAWALGIIAILFNPVLTIELDKYTWQPIDFFIALILGGFLFKKRLIRYIVIISLGILGILLVNIIFQQNNLSRSNTQIIQPKFNQNKYRVMKGGLKSKFPDKFPSKFRDSGEE